MGSWNATCMITNLPITYLDDVVGFLLFDQTVDGKEWGDVFSLPLYGKYDTYGCLDYAYDGTSAIEDLTLEFIRARFARNDAHKSDRPPDLGKMKIEDVLKAAERYRVNGKGVILKSESYGSPEMYIGRALVLRWVFDAMVEGVETHFDRRLSGRSKTWRERCVADVRELFELAEEHRNPKKLPEDPAEREEEAIERMKRKHLKGKILRNAVCASSTCFPRELPEYLAWRKEPDITGEIEAEFLKLIKFCVEMDAMRKEWTGVSIQAGSQARCFDMHAKIARGTLAHIERTVAEDEY